MDERTRRRAGTAVAAALGVDALAHLYWATGATWPAPDRRWLADAVVGAPGLSFRPGVVLPLAGLLGAGAAVVLARSRSWGGRRTGAALGLATTVVAVALLARGLVGLVWATGAGVGTGTPFYWSNLLATPLCLALAAATALVTDWRRRWLPALAGGLTVAVVATAAGGAYLYRPGPTSGYRAPASIQSSPSRWVDTTLARFHYVREGEGPPLVLLSPGGSWLFAWADQLARLSDSHTIYVVDMPGQGFTELRDDGFAWDLDAMTGAVGTFLDAVDLDRTALAGNSWSGGWALAYAQRHPERVSRLVLLAPSGLDEPDIWSWEMLKLPLVGELVANVAYGRSTVAATVGDLFVHPELATEDVVEAMWAPGTFVDNRRALYLLERELDWRVTEEAMSSTETPTLVVWGDGDQVLDPQQAERFGDLLPDVEVQVLPGCGHALTLDCPEQVTDLMEGFLGGR